MGLCCSFLLIFSLVLFDLGPRAPCCQGENPFWKTNLCLTRCQIFYSDFALQLLPFSYSLTHCQQSSFCDLLRCGHRIGTGEALERSVNCSTGETSSTLSHKYGDSSHHSDHANSWPATGTLSLNSPKLLQRLPGICWVLGGGSAGELLRRLPGRLPLHCQWAEKLKSFQQSPQQFPRRSPQHRKPPPPNFRSSSGEFQLGGPVAGPGTRKVREGARLAKVMENLHLVSLVPRAEKRPDAMVKLTKTPPKLILATIENTQAKQHQVPRALADADSMLWARREMSKCLLPPSWTWVTWPIRDECRSDA